MDSDEVIYICPVCGYPKLTDEPHSEISGASLEICPSCGIQFGYDDEAGGNPDRRKQIHLAWRQKWIANHMPWASVGTKPPHEWDPKKQLRNIGIKTER